MFRGAAVVATLLVTLAVAAPNRRVGGASFDTLATNPYAKPPRPPIAQGDLRVQGPEQLWEQVVALEHLYATMGGVNWHRRWGWDVLEFLPLGNITGPCASVEEPVQIFAGVMCQSGAFISIDLTANNVVGLFPAYDTFWKAFADTNMDFVFDHNPGVYGPPPSGFPLSHRMRTFSAMFCNLTGTIPDTLFTAKIQNLALNNNQLTINPLPDAVGNALDLLWLYIGSNANTGGSIPAAICKCHLMGLDLTGPSNFNGLPDCFGKSQQESLIVLNLYDNDFTGQIPDSWCHLTSLQHFYVQLNTGLSGTLPDCIQYWSNLVSLAVLNTQVGGPFPSWVFNLRKMQNLILGVSEFSGPIPDNFFMFDGLVTVLLSGSAAAGSPNTYTGPMPVSLFEQSQLTLIEIQNTQLVGTLPRLNHLQWLCMLYINENPSIGGVFPVELLTDVWNTNISAAKQQFPRSINIAQSTFMGLLPDLTVNESRKLLDLNTQPYAFYWQSDNWYGYIPDSLSTWLPPLSWPGLLLNNANLWFPIPDKFSMMVAPGFTGIQAQLTAVAGQPWDMDGGTNVTIDGEFGGAPAVYSVAIYRIENSTSAIFALSDEEAWNARFASAELVFPPSLPSHTPIVAAAATLITPRVERDMNALWLALFDVNYTRDGRRTVARVSSSTLTVASYNPRPDLLGITPVTGRRVGCTSATVVGSGFTNAPNPALVFMSDYDVQPVIVVDSNVVITNDTMATFELPLPNASDVNQRYPDGVGVLTVRLLPNGLLHPRQVSPQTFVKYRFEELCESAWGVCGHDHVDPEGCSSSPLCQCNSRGTCNATGHTCRCDEGFTGFACSNCTFNRFSPACLPCDCDHGTCNWGAEADGSCNCEKDWFGKRCNYSKIATAILVPLSVIVLAIAAFVVKWRCRAKPQATAINQELLNPGKRR